MRVDAHNHVWDLGVRELAWTHGLPALQKSFGIDELTEELTSHGVDRSVLTPSTAGPDETPELLAIAAVNPLVAGVVGWVDLTAPDVSEQIATLRDLVGGHRLVGIRHPVLSEADSRWLNRADVRRGLEAVAEADLAYDLLVGPDQRAPAVEAIRAVPQLRVVLNHGGSPLIASGDTEGWRTYVRGLAELPNVAVKLSGLITEADRWAWVPIADRPVDARPGWTVPQLEPYVEELLAAFGPSRVMFGSDWPTCLLAATYDEVISAARTLTFHLSEQEQSWIFGGTAESWYGL